MLVQSVRKGLLIKSSVCVHGVRSLSYLKRRGFSTQAFTEHGGGRLLSAGLPGLSSLARERAALTLGLVWRSLLAARFLYGSQRGRKIYRYV